MQNQPFDIFAIALPGLEAPLLEEIREAGFEGAKAGDGGVTFPGGWPDVWRANIVLRGASRILARFASFRALHLAQLDKRARKVPWGDILRPDVPVKVEATCRKSRIYHGGAASQRVARAITEELGAPISDDAALRIMVRIEDDLCTISLDTSGEGLHRRGHKTAVGKAPLRETMAALFLRQCGYRGGEPVLDPMCGSGTFPIEAAEIAAGVPAGRARRFAFEDLVNLDADAVMQLRTVPGLPEIGPSFFGYDRDQGAIANAAANADRAGVGAACRFTCQPISALVRPDGPAGLVMVNPPYGGRIGAKKMLYGLYSALGARLSEEFSGWRVGLVTTEGGLARATGLPLHPPGPPVAHGGLKVRLWQSDPLR